jgi:hypothetical protein
MILNVWSYPSEPTAYQITGVDGRQMTIVFLPSKETLFHYKHSANEEEYVLTKMKGVYGTHYLGPIWTVEGPTISFGLRWVSRNAKPVLMEIEWKNKQILGDMRSTFPDKGRGV